MERDSRTHKLIGTGMEVYTIIGSGHLEAVYHECLEIEFENRKIPFVSKPQLVIYDKERELKKYYIPDFILFELYIFLTFHR